MEQYNPPQYGATSEEEVAGKIFIGGLSWQTTEQTLREHFERFGELADVALMYDKRTNKPRGFGFVRMRDAEAAEAIMNEEHTIDGRLVDVKRALPRDKAPGPAAKAESLKIFVGGLCPEVTESEFTSYFETFGAVRDAVVMMDRATGVSRGFGFVTFESERVLEDVLRARHELQGKPVEVKRAEPRGGGGERGGYGDRDGGRREYSSQGDRYGGRQDYGGYSQGGYGDRGGYGRYPSQAMGGYGYRGGYGMAVPYGYGAPGAAQSMGYYGAAAAAAGAYPGGAYGGAGQSQGGDYGRGPSDPYGAEYAPRVSSGSDKGSHDASAIAASYASAAMQMRSQQQQQYGYGAPMAGYGPSGGSGSSYGYAAHQPQQSSSQRGGGGSGAAGESGNGSSGSGNGGSGAYADPAGYGAYRGQDHRASRSYRPY